MNKITLILSWLILLIGLSCARNEDTLKDYTVAGEKTGIDTTAPTVSSVSPDDLMAGKILGLGMLGLVQMMFYLLLGFVIAYFRDIPIIDLNQFPVFMIYFITGYLFYSAIYATMGTFFNSEQEAQQSSGLIGIIAVLPVVFSSYFITNPGSNFTIFLSYFPPVTPFMMILRLGTGTVEMIEIIITTFILIICCWGMLIFSGKIFGISP